MEQMAKQLDSHLKQSDLATLQSVLDAFCETKRLAKTSVAATEAAGLLIQLFERGVRNEPQLFAKLFGRTQ